MNERTQTTTGPAAHYPTRQASQPDPASAAVQRGTEGAAWTQPVAIPSASAVLSGSINAILAFGMTLAILIGGIDLSVGAVVALAGTVAVASLRHGGWPVAAFAGMGTAAAFGLVNGVCAARTRMPPT